MIELTLNGDRWEQGRTVLSVTTETDNVNITQYVTIIIITSALHCLIHILQERIKRVLHSAQM